MSASDASSIKLFPEPDPDDRSSYAHRQLIGCVGLLLPPLLWFMAGTRPTDPLPAWKPLGSISAYYYSGAVSAFTGGMIAMALFLFAYRGYENNYGLRDRVLAIIAGIAGLVVLVTGLIAIVRGGFDGPMSTPIVQVVGFNHTTTLGLIEIGLGLALLMSAATRSRSGEVFFGAVLGIAGFVGAVQTESFKKTLALESSMAWLAVAIGAIVVLAALMLPRYARQSTVVNTV